MEEEEEGNEIEKQQPHVPISHDEYNFKYYKHAPIKINELKRKITYFRIFVMETS